MSKIDFDVIKSAYGWTISTDGELHGLIAGDMGYEPTGIKLDADSLEIWELGFKAWEKMEAEKEKREAAAQQPRTAKSVDSLTECW